MEQAQLSTSQLTQFPSAAKNAREHIDDIDFTQIIAKLAKEKGWSKRSAELASQQYRNYLYLQKKYGHHFKLIPSKDIDTFWHLHILDTKKYHQDCQAIFGQYLHHKPFYEGIEVKLTDKQNPFSITQELYYQEYNEYIYSVKTGALKNVAVLVEYFFKGLKKVFNLNFRRTRYEKVVIDS